MEIGREGEKAVGRQAGKDDGRREVRMYRGNNVGTKPMVNVGNTMNDNQKSRPKKRKTLRKKEERHETRGKCPSKRRMTRI
jgi:hypothetical protein